MKNQTDNFTADDLQELGAIKDLEQMKEKAMSLISNPHTLRPMKPEKVAWFRTHMDSLHTTERVIKLMWDLLLAGDGMAVVGSKSNTTANRYRKTFG